MFSLFIVNFWWLSTYLCSYNLEEVIDFCSIITCHVCMSLDVDIIHSPQRSLGKGICLLILFSTLLACYVSSLLFQIILLLTKWRVSFILIYDYLYIMFTCEFAVKTFLGLYNNPVYTAVYIFIYINFVFNHLYTVIWSLLLAESYGLN
jgi:hypothetical protein